MKNKEARILIEGIKDEIDKKLKILGMKPEVSPSEFFRVHRSLKHRYFSPVEDKKETKRAFYARCHNNLDAKRKFIREANFLNKIQKSSYQIKSAIPKIILWRKEKNFEWMVREYIEGIPLEHNRELKSKIEQEKVKKLALLVNQISKINPSEFSTLKIERFNIKNYLAEDLLKGLSMEGILSSSVVGKLLKKIKKTMPLLERENKYFAQGDLNLGNIIVGEKNKLWIIDWELIHVNNFAYDICYLWVHLWNTEKKIRKALIEEYIKKLTKEKLSKFKKLLPVVASYLSLGGVKIKHEKEKEEYFEKRKRFYKSLLVNSTKNFENLIKV